MGLNATLSADFNRIEAMGPDVDESVSDICNIPLECASCFIPNIIITMISRDKLYIKQAG